MAVKIEEVNKGMKMLETNFAKLKKSKACINQYKALAKRLGGIKKYGQETPITLLQVLDILGFNDALRVLDNAIPGKEALLFSMRLGVDYAERVLPVFEKEYPNEKSVRNLIEVTSQYVASNATDEELAKARSDAGAIWVAAEYAKHAKSAGVAAWAAWVVAAWAAWVVADPSDVRAAWVVFDPRDAWVAEQKEQEKILRAYLEVS